MEQQDVLDGLTLELRRGTIVLCVLRQLATPMYGYSLIQVLGSSGVTIEANTLYPLLRRLESQGLLESTWETSTGKPRKYYVATPRGREVCEQLKKRWDETVLSVKKLWEGNCDE